jgi:hypothetical protein
MTTFPIETPVTIPVDPTVAIAVLLLLHVPPDVASVKVTDVPGQIVAGSVITGATAGKGITVSVLVA